MTSAQVETATYFEENPEFETKGRIPFHDFSKSDTCEGVYCGNGRNFDTKFGTMHTHLFYDFESGFFMIKATTSLDNILKEEPNLGAHVYRIKALGKATTKNGFQCNIFNVQRSKNPIGNPIEPEVIQNILK